MLEWKSSTSSRRPSHVYLRSGFELWDHSLQSSPLMTRGWTLQEGLLAPGTLSYGAQQMIWECSQYQSDEGGRITKSTEDYRSKGLFNTSFNAGERRPSDHKNLSSSDLAYDRISQRNGGCRIRLRTHTTNVTISLSSLWDVP